MVDYFGSVSLLTDMYQIGVYGSATCLCICAVILLYCMKKFYERLCWQESDLGILGRESH